MPQLIGAYGSVVLRYRSLSEGNLYAALMLRNVGHSIAFHADGTGAILDYEAGSREGIWWLPNDALTDYLMLSNLGDAPLSLELTLFDAAGTQFQQKVPLGPRQMRRISVRALVRQGGLTGSYGGIRVSAAAHAGSFDTLFLLFDQSTGFSAVLKMFDHDPNATLEQRDYAHTSVWALRAPLLALTQPDPAMEFPDGTTLHPQLLIRNTTGKRQTASLRFSWRGDTATGKATGPSLLLGPYETRRVDVAALQDGKTLPRDAHWTSVTITTDGQPDEVMAIAASYDGGLQHGAQTAFSDQLSFAGEGGMWEYDAQHNSIIAVGNGGSQATTAAFTLFYQQGTQRYDVEQALQPDEQMWIDVGKLIRQRLPDKNGRVLPSDLSSGSYEFRDLSSHPGGTLFEGKVIYEKTYGHAVYGCNECCYYGPGVWLVFDPLGIPLLGGAQNGVVSYDCNGTLTDVSGYFFGGWSTVDPTVATVNSSGYHNGVGVGTTTTNLVGSIPERRGIQCPLVQVRPRGGVNVVTLGSFQFTLLSTPIPGEGNSVISGQSAQVQVQAFDNMGNQFPGYRGTVHFSSTDAAATLPADYTFVASDAGSHVFNATLKTVVGTGPQRDLTVTDTASGIHATQNIYVWWQVNMDVEFWKECNFVQCPQLGSYFCATAYNPSGYAQKTAFLAITASSSTLANQSIKVRNGPLSQVAFVGDAGPVLNYPYWNTGAPPPTVAGCLSDLLATNVGISNGCNGSTGYGGGVILWRFGN
jgi:hypothetical protein